MLIDWFTVAAQFVNFLILVWLLKRFLYKPILTAIDTREGRIARDLGDAAATKAAAQKSQEELTAKSAAFDTERQGLLAKALEQATAERGRLLADAHKAADELGLQERAALDAQRGRLTDHLKRLATGEVFAICRKVLADLAGAGLEDRMIERFAGRLRALAGPDKEQFGHALTHDPRSPIVLSVFEMPPPARAVLQGAFNETFGRPIRLQFSTSPDAICGIEVTAAGLRLAWSDADYLASLERQVAALFDAPAAPAAPATPAAAAAPAPAAPAQPPRIVGVA